MKTRTVQSRLEILQRSRSLPRDASGLEASVAGVLRELRAAHRQAESAAEAWRTVVPAAVAALVASAESGGGVLKLKPKASTGRFVIDRWLRSGGLAALRAADPKIKSVTVLAAGRKKS